MLNQFKHTGYVTLSDGRQLPYAFGPNQSAILCQLMGWEFWEHEEKVLPALYTVSLYSQISTNPEATPEQVAEALQLTRRSLFNNPVFVQNFYTSCLQFGAELDRVPFELTAAEVGMYQQAEPTAFLPALTHYAQLQADRVAVASVRPVSAPAKKKRSLKS